MDKTSESYKDFPHAGLALDPIHVGTGGSRLGRVENTIVRDPVTRIPKIPGSSLAGVIRAYVAMKKEENRSREKPYYPDCAGQGQADAEGKREHCGKKDCEICVVFGFAKGERSGFAALAGFSDAHVLLFPVATREGPKWVTAPMALRQLEKLKGIKDLPDPDAIFFKVDSPDLEAKTDSPATTGNAEATEQENPLNLGWLTLPVKHDWGSWEQVHPKLQELHVSPEIMSRVVVVSDKHFSYVVNSNLEVRTSVAINPETGAAQEGALFTYEALPRGTVLYWDVTCRNPKHFKSNDEEIKVVKTPEAVHRVVDKADPLLEHLGIGGMGTRGMGRLRVLNNKEDSSESDAPTEGEEKK